MLIMEPDGAITACTPSPAEVAGEDSSLERMLLSTENLGHDIAAEVRAIIDAKLAQLSGRLGPVAGPGWTVAIG